MFEGRFPPYNDSLSANSNLEGGGTPGGEGGLRCWLGLRKELGGDLLGVELLSLQCACDEGEAGG